MLGLQNPFFELINQWVIMRAILKIGGVFMPSLVAEVGDAIDDHLKYIDMIKSSEMDEHQRQFLEAKLKLRR